MKGGPHLVCLIVLITIAVGLAQANEPKQGNENYSTLNRMKKTLSSDPNSTQILPSITDTESGSMGKGVKGSRSADSMKMIFIYHC